jgi:hypothetical protein
MRLTQSWWMSPVLAGGVGLQARSCTQPVGPPSPVPPASDAPPLPLVPVVPLVLTRPLVPDATPPLLLPPADPPPLPALVPLLPVDTLPAPALLPPVVDPLAPPLFEDDRPEPERPPGPAEALQPTAAASAGTSTQDLAGCIVGEVTSARPRGSQIAHLGARTRDAYLAFTVPRE